ncbi:hypothetical protein P879_08548, partial [Paragonimus westermani]
NCQGFTWRTPSVCAHPCARVPLHTCSCVLSRVRCIQIPLTDFRSLKVPLNIDNSVLALKYVQP